MKLKINNKETLDNWLNLRRKWNRDCQSIKGKPPVGATYDDGGLIIGLVNIAWRDCTTGELFNIEYSKEEA